MCDLKKYLVFPTDSVRRVIACIDHNTQQIALVVDEQRRLLGTITDGDIRRALLQGLDLKTPISQVLEKRTATSRPSPITAPLGAPRDWLLGMMRAYTLRHIPLLDHNGRVVDLALLSELVQEAPLPLTAVVMAGGFGTRLRPLTDKVPKPMLPVGDRPLLERIIDNLRQSGVSQVMLTTHYKGEVIEDHFGDGSRFGVDINYLSEGSPLGTAGVLFEMRKADKPFVVINGDILTGLDFRAMLQFHDEHKAEMTVAARRYESQVPYGVIEADGVEVKVISEKPIYDHFINAGIYLLNPGVCRYIPQRAPYQMPELISSLLADKKRVVCFPVREYWRDIGQIDDYVQAQNDYQQRKVS